MTAATMDDKALLAVPKAPPPPPAAMIVEVARKHGVSPFRQLREMMTLNLSQGRIYPPEYYSTGLFDPDMSMDEKRQFVGVRGSRRINDWLSPDKLLTMQNFVANKFMFTSLITQLGFRTTETQAVVSNTRRFGAVPVLSDAGSLKKFLTEKARFPLFGKPTAYSGSFGSVLLERLEGETIVLGNGRAVALEAFCKEIVSEYGAGYLLQSALEQHHEMEAMTGRAVGSVRVVTVRQETMPNVLYALWKIPAPEAMSDNFWQDGSMIAPVDAATGEVGQAWIGTGLKAQQIERHPVSGRMFRGFEIPQWQEACRMAREAHALFPEFGVIGWDVAITPEGPAIIECNDNPFHTLYQQAFRRGVRNPEFEAVFEKVGALSARMLADRQERIKARKNARKG